MENYECKCEGAFYTDSMCKGCLLKVERVLLEKIEVAEDKLADLECDLDQVQFHLEAFENDK